MERAPKMQVVPPALSVVKKVEREIVKHESPTKKEKEVSQNAPPMLMPPPQERYIKMGDYDFF